MQILPYNRDFLKQLDSHKHKTIYARITSLTFEEMPVETVEGRVSGGSINIDGASAVRRTCSLTIVAQDFNYNDYYWGLNTKFKLEIGVENNIDPNYPNIIWFKQGIFIITSFNTSQSTSSFTISISGKDKMCLLNGEVSGNLEAQTDFGTIEEQDRNGIWTKRKIPIIDIIKNAVHVYGGEPIHNIIINDLPEEGLELLEYRYDLPMYLYRQVNSNLYDNALIDGEKLCRVGDPNSEIAKEEDLKDLPIIALKDLKSENLDLLIDDLMGVNEPSLIYFDDDFSTPYKVAKIEYGQTAGYRKTDLVYAGDLVANIGESLVSVLDKIKNMLGEFEYFYDIDGRFIFQQKKTYVNIPWLPTGTDEQKEPMITASLAESSATAYTFNSGELITQFNNNPNLMNARNDYVIRGERTGISGSALAIIMRYAIDIKPQQYNSIIVSEFNEDDKIAIETYNNKNNTTLEYQEESSSYAVDIYDWREIIYQMARDYYKYNWMDDFELKVAKANIELYPTGRTGYEQYYMDMISYWRDLYYPKDLLEKDRTKINEKLIPINNVLTGDEKYPGGLEEFVNNVQPAAIVTAQQDLKEADSSTIQEKYINLIQAKAKLEIATEELKYYIQLKENYDAQLELLDQKSKNFIDIINDDKAGWHRDVFDHPELLNFWFDFLDSEGELSNLNVKAIGARTKSVNDSNIKAIYFRETPDLFFVPTMAEVDTSNTAYRFIQVPSQEMEEMFSISAQGKSAKTKLDELINQHGYCTESATITTIPIYYLEPNTRIHLYDSKTSLDGDYLVSKISLPLTYNGTMSITATKAPKNIF